MNNKTYTVLITSEARHMLKEHITFLARVSISAAKVLREDLLSRIKSLETTPYLCPVFFSDSLETEYRKLVYKRYLILYNIDETDRIVRVKYIWDSRQNNQLLV